MVVASGDAAVHRAMSTTACRPGMCLQYVRTWLDIPPLYPTAASAWRNARHRHPGDRSPKRGAPVFFLGGSSGAGHIALWVGDGTGKMRSTDAIVTGDVSNVPIDWIERNWHEQYVGWTEDLNNLWIPWLRSGGTAATSKWDGGRVYCSKLHRGITNSDSVRRLQYQLAAKKIDRMPITGDYTDQVRDAVRKWQLSIGDRGANADGNMGPLQAERFFPSAYHVIDDT